MAMRKASDGSNVYPSNATQMVRSECGKCAREQGGTMPSSGPAYSRPQTSMKDIAGGDPPRSGGDGMGHAAGEYRVRSDQDYDDHYYMD